MAHPYHHALSSVRHWGGTVADYQSIHDWFGATIHLRWKGGKLYDAIRSIHSGFVLPEPPSRRHRVTARKMCGGYTAATAP